MFNLKIANIDRLLNQKNNSEYIQNTSQEITDYINSICQDNKKCEKYYFQQILNLGKSNSITLENIKEIKYKDVEINNDYKLFINRLSNYIRDFNKVPNLQEWVIKQLPNVLVEDYNDFFVDIKTFSELQDDERFPHKDITQVSSPKELRQLITPFIKREVIITTNQEWVGKWIYNKDEVSVFKSYDPSTISQISNKYQTRWCIKDPNVAKENYKCETQPMYFVFIYDKIVCVVHLETNQIKDVHDTALNDIGIIRTIDPVLSGLNLLTEKGDFQTYDSILYEWKESLNTISKLSPAEKINYLKELIQTDIKNINIIDKNFIIYNKEIQDLSITRLNIKKDELLSDNHNPYNLLPTIPQELYSSVPGIKKIYLSYWEALAKEYPHTYANSCPSYICKEQVIQDNLVIGIEKVCAQEPLNYLSFKGSYPEIMNKHFDKFSQYIQPCVARMKEEISKDDNKYIIFTESKENVPEIFKHNTYNDELELCLIKGISHHLYDFPKIYEKHSVVIEKHRDLLEKYLTEQISEFIKDNPNTLSHFNDNFAWLLKKVRPTIVSSLFEGIKIQIKKNPEKFVELNTLYPWLFKKNLNELEDLLVSSIKGMITESNILSFLSLMKRGPSFTGFFPIILKKHESEIEDETLVYIEQQCNKKASNYSDLFAMFPDIINKYKIIFDEYLPKCVDEISKSIEKIPIYYKKYLNQIPHVFNDVNFKDTLLDSLLKGINMRLISDPIDLSDLSKAYPEIFQNEKYKSDIETSFVNGVKSEIKRRPSRYVDLFLQSPYMVTKYAKDIEPVLIKAIESVCYENTIYYFTFKTTNYICNIMNKYSDTFNKYIEKCVYSMAFKIRNNSEYYFECLKFKTWVPEIFNNNKYMDYLDNIIVENLRDHDKVRKMYFNKYYHQYPEFFNKYNLASNASQSITSNKNELTTSNNWYKLFKSSKNNRISI